MSPSSAISLIASLAGSPSLKRATSCCRLTRERGVFSVVCCRCVVLKISSERHKSAPPPFARKSHPNVRMRTYAYIHTIRRTQTCKRPSSFIQACAELFAGKLHPDNIFNKYHHQRHDAVAVKWQAIRLAHSARSSTTDSPGCAPR